MVEFTVFGSIELHGAHGEEIIQILSQPKRLALLAYLAAAKPRGFHRRDKIVGFFWPELDQEHARAGLRRSLHFLRQFLGKDVVIRRGHGEVGLNWENVWCDCKAFEEALERGKVEEAVKLYRGDLLSGLFLPDSPGFERWLDEERVATKEAAAAATWTVANRLVESCSDENQVQRFISTLAAAGDRAGAIQFYERFSEGIRSALDLEPSEASKLLDRKIRGEIEKKPPEKISVTRLS